MSDERTYWFVANIRNCQFQKISRTLADLGVEHYIPDGFRTLLFIHCQKSRALSLANSGAIAAKYIIDHETRTLLQIPEKQMSDFMMVMNLAPDAECLTSVPITKGTMVQVIKGPLKGVEGEVMEASGGIYLTVKVSTLLCAKVEIPKSYLIALTR